MIEVGMRNQAYGTDNFQPLHVTGRPTSMPNVPEGHYVVCGYEQCLGEKLFIRETVEDMQELYDACGRGFALSIKWYAGHEEIGTIERVNASKAE